MGRYFVLYILTLTLTPTITLIWKVFFSFVLYILTLTAHLTPNKHVSSAARFDPRGLGDLVGKVWQALHPNGGGSGRVGPSTK